MPADSAFVGFSATYQNAEKDIAMKKQIIAGNLVIDSPETYWNYYDVKNSIIDGQYGTRVNLYEVPENVTDFKVVLDYTINNIYGNGTPGVGLIYADNCQTDFYEKSTETEEDTRIISSSFDLIWLRAAAQASGQARRWSE